MAFFIHAPFSGRGGGWTPNPFQSYNFPSSDDERDEWDDYRDDMGGIEIIGPLDNGHYTDECTLQKCICGVTEEAEKLWECFSDFWKMISSEEE